MATHTINDAGIRMDLVEALAAHKGWSVSDTLAWAADSGIRRLAALDRHKAQSWAGKADTSAPAPGRKGKAKATKGKATKGKATKGKATADVDAPIRLFVHDPSMAEGIGAPRGAKRGYRTRAAAMKARDRLRAKGEDVRAFDSQGREVLS